RLIDKGLMAAADLPRLAEAQASAPSRPVHELVIERGFAREEDVLAVLADEFGMEVVDLTNVTVRPETLKPMPLTRVHRRLMTPLERASGPPRGALGNPFDVYARDEPQTPPALIIARVLASPRKTPRLIKIHFGVGGETVTAMVEERGDVELLEET